MMMYQFYVYMEIIFILFIGLLMGIITSISGGAGVFAVPIMLSLGLPPLNVLSLNRTSDVGTVFGALRSYYKAGTIDWKLAGIIAIPLALGSLLGASIIVRLPPEIIKYVILVGVLIGIFFLLIKKTEPQVSLNKRIKWTSLSLMFLVGIWKGALAMAGTTFAVLILVYFFHKNYLQARSTELVAGIPETLISATILIANSTTSVSLLLCMFAASFVGSLIGSSIAVKKGNTFIKKMIVCIAILMVIKLLADVMF